MDDTSEVIEVPLLRELLGARYRQLCADPRFANLPGKIELDTWGRILISPASNEHGMVQARLCSRLASLGGEVIAKASVATIAGLLVADVAWIADEALAPPETPLQRAPQLCIEIASPSNSRKELVEKVAAYLGAGALEVWIVFPRVKRIDCFDASGPSAQSRYPVDLGGLFDRM